MGTPTRTDTFDYNKDYRQIIQIAGRIDQDWAYNELQQEVRFAQYDINDQVFQEGAVLSGLTATSLNNTTGAAVLANGSVYLYGRQENVTGTTLNYGTTVAVNTIYVQWLLNQITKTQDATLADPNTGAAVFEELQTQTTLASSTPDAFDETFETFTGGVPHNSLLNANWTLGSGVIAQGTPARFGRYALQMNYAHGTATTVTSPTFTVAASTTYTLYFWTKTVYGQTDLQASDGSFVKVNLVSPSTTTFATTGGATLAGGYTLHSTTFATGATDTSATVTISIPATATPSSTQILIDGILITTSALGATTQERHYTAIYTWNRPTTPTVITPVITPKSALKLTDLSGTLPATSVSYPVLPDASQPPDITGPTVESAIDQLGNQRALLAGSATQVFSVANAATSAQAPNAGQIINSSLTYCGASTGSANTYTITLPVSATLAVGALLRFIANATNTGASTIVIGANTYTILRPDGTNTQAGDILNGAIVTLHVLTISTPFKVQISIPPAQYVTQADPQNYAVDTGTANAYAVALTPVPITPITAGFPVKFKALNSNTGASTLALNGATAVNIIRTTGGALLANDIFAGGVFELVFDGTSYQLVSIPGSLILPQQIYGQQGSNKVKLASPVALSTTNTTVLTAALTMPTTGVHWFAHIHVHTFTQILTNPNTAGTTVDVTWTITDNTTPTPNTDQLGVVSATAETANVLKKKHFNDHWIVGPYNPSQAVTITLEALYQVVTGSEGTAPTVLANNATWMQWALLSSN